MFFPFICYFISFAFCFKFDLDLNTHPYQFKTKKKKVPDVTTVELHGLEHVHFLDQLTKTTAADEHPFVTFSRETDRIYKDCKGGAFTLERGDATQVLIKHSAGFPDAVVWNPWIEKSLKMADFGDEEYKIMCCVEAAVVMNPVHLLPGASWSAEQTLCPQI